MSLTIILSSLIGVGGYLLKHQLAQRAIVLTKKRQVYEEISTALRVFVAGGGTTDNDKGAFLEQYSKLWLWASDSVIQAANEFLDIMAAFDESNPEKQMEAKRAYAKFVIEMRRELGFPKTSLVSGDYRFHRF